MNKENTFKVIDREGKEIEFEILFTFESDETKKNYMVYTDNTKDDEGNTKVYASVFNPEAEPLELLPVETEREWKIIETIITSITEESKKEKKEKEDKNQINRLDQKRERRSRRAFFLLSPISRKTLSGKVSLCTFLKKASLTLETAMALPLFFFGVLTLLSFMDIYKVQTEHLTGLCQKAKEAGMYAYGAGGSGTETITLPDVYSYQPIGGLIPLPKIWFHNTIKVHTWNGVVYENGKDTVESQPMVYVTESGSVYHRKLGCSYLNLSVQQISGSSVKALKNAYGEKYQACELCSRGQEPAGVVYHKKE